LWGYVLLSFLLQLDSFQTDPLCPCAFYGADQQVYAPISLSYVLDHYQVMEFLCLEQASLTDQG
jgi:hypothetical protein